MNEVVIYFYLCDWLGASIVKLVESLDQQNFMTRPLKGYVSEDLNSLIVLFKK